MRSQERGSGSERERTVEWGALEGAGGRSGTTDSNPTKPVSVRRLASQSRVAFVYVTLFARVFVVCFYVYVRVRCPRVPVAAIHRMQWCKATGVVE